MNVTFACPHCDQATRQNLDVDESTLRCDHCGQEIQVPSDARSGSRLHRCLVCPSTDLFVRKDFPQRLGVVLVVVGFIASSIAWGYGQVLLTFAILFATALLDVLLFALVGDALMCYRCHAQYRQVEGMDLHGSFDLETHERYRQQEARLAATKR